LSDAILEEEEEPDNDDSLSDVDVDDLPQEDDEEQCLDHDDPSHKPQMVNFRLLPFIFKTRFWVLGE